MSSIGLRYHDLDILCKVLSSSFVNGKNEIWEEKLHERLPVKFPNRD